MIRPANIALNIYARRLFAGLLLLVAACGPITISELTPTPAPTTTAPPTATASLTPLPTYAPPTETPTPTNTPTPDPGEGPTNPKVNTSADAEAALQNSEEIPLLVNDILQESELGSRNVPLELRVSLTTDRITWDNWWCAATNAILAGNVAVMGVLYELNSEPIEVEEHAFIYQQFLQDGTVCQVTAFYLSEWPTGEHELRYTITFTGNVNDGFGVYSAGDYVTVYKVTVP